MQLLPREREPREQRVLLEEEIADREPGEEIHLRELAQLAYPLEKEEQLRRQREAGHVLVEARQERILLGALQDQGRVQPAGQAPGEARLADADGSFDDDVMVFRERHGAGVAEMGAHHTRAAAEGSRAPLPPEIDRIAALAHFPGAVLQETLEARLAQVSPARDVFERAPEME